MRKIFLTIVMIIASLSLLISKEAPTKLYVWGNNEGSKLGFYKFDSLQQVGTDRDWKQVSLGRAISAGIKYDGTLWAWGLSRYWKESDTSLWSEYTPVQFGNESNWKQVAVHEMRLIAIKNNGTMWIWGKDKNDKINPLISKLNELTQFGFENDWEWAKIIGDYGNSCTYAQKMDGSLWVWGENYFVQLGDGTFKKIIEPVKISSGIGWKSFSSNGYSFFSVKNDGSLWFWGYKGTKNDSVSRILTEILPIRIGNDNDWISSDFSEFPVAVKNDGSVWAWDWIKEKIDGIIMSQYLDFDKQPIFLGENFKEFKFSGYFYMGVKQDNSVVHDWFKYREIDTLSNKYFLNPKNRFDNVKSVSLYCNELLIIKEDSTLWAIGSNFQGELGLISRHANIPVEINDSENWKEICIGSHQSAGIKSDSTYWVWGHNFTGLLGNGTYKDSDLPVKVRNDNNWIKAGSGSLKISAIRNDGTLWANWSDWNPLRELLIDSGLVQLGIENDWTDILLGEYAVKKDSSIWHLNLNLYIVNQKNSLTNFRPVKLIPNNRWIALSYLNAFSFAIASDSSLWSCHSYVADTLTLFDSKNKWVKISQEDLNLYCIKSDGTLWNWKDYNILKNPIAIQVGADSNWADIKSGYYHTLALKKDGSLWVMGDNLHGQLGIPKTGYFPIPTRIGEGIRWKNIDAKGVSSTAFGQEIALLQVEPPVLISPDSNAVNIDINSPLVWHKSDNADEYIYEVSYDELFEKILFTGIVGDTTVMLKNMKYYKMYYWRVKALNNVDTSGWSVVWNFETMHQPVLEPPDNWKFISKTGNNSLIIVPFKLNSQLLNRPFESGDAVGAFYLNNGEFICAGYEKFVDKNIAVTVWGDNDQTESKDGFFVYENYTIKVWDSKLGQEFAVEVSYSEGKPYYTVNGYSVIGAFESDSTTESQEIKLLKGWNLISSYIIPEKIEIDEIVKPIVDKVKVVKDNAGKVFIHEQDINKLTKWNIEEGYQFYMYEDAVLTIKGIKIIPEEQTVNIYNGWNLISYLRDNPMDISVALESLVLDSTLKIVKNNEGKVFIPELDINTIGNMNPGEGYQVFALKPSIWKYPSNEIKGIIKSPNDDYSNFYQPEFSKTGNNSVLICKIEGSDDGDEVGIFSSNGHLIGSGKIKNGLASVTVWGNNEQTNILDGADDYEDLKVEYYNIKTGKLVELEITNIINLINKSPISDLKFSKDGLLFAESNVTEVLKTNNIDVNINPNPISDLYNVEINLKEQTLVSIMIYNSEGSLLDMLFEGNLSQGPESFQFDSSILPVGFYNVVVIANGEKFSKKIVKIK